MNSFFCKYKYNRVKKMECIICLEIKEELFFFTCSHFTCVSCYKSLRQININKCPICRSTIGNISYKKYDVPIPVDLFEHESHTESQPMSIVIQVPELSEIPIHNIDVQEVQIQISQFQRNHCPIKNICYALCISSVIFFCIAITSKIK